MYEKTEHKDRPSLSVQSIPAKSTPVVNPPDVVTSHLKDIPAPTVSPQPHEVSVIGSEVVFKGELIAGNEMIIRGRVEGTIAHQSKHIVIAKEGCVRALIHATSVRVEGQVDGDIHCDDCVELMAGSKVDGNIFCSAIKIEKGARLNGTVIMV